MPLQASGPISISQIRTELINVSTLYSLRALSAAANKTSPDAMSEFYGYSACTPAGTYYTQFCSGYNLYYTYHNGSCGYYNSLIQTNSPTCGCQSGCQPAGTFLTGRCLCSACNVYGVTCSEWAQFPYGSNALRADGCCGSYYTLDFEFLESCYDFCIGAGYG